MALKKVENTHGAALYRLQTVIAQLSLMSNYTPTLPEDSLAELQNLQQSLQQVSDAEAAKESVYSQSTKARVNAFKKDEYSVEKLLKYIRSAISTRYGKDADETELVAGYIRKIRGKSRPSAEAIGAAASGTTTRRSQSHRSYGSLIFSFRDLIRKVETMDYRSNRPEYQIPQLLSFAQNLETLNQQVEQNLVELKILRDQRNRLLAEIPLRLHRIKNNVLLDFGIDSQEYLTLKSI